jgi:hypothetical protein
MLLDKIKDAKICGSWEQSCAITVNSLFEDILELDRRYSEGFSLTFGTLNFDKNHLMNMILTLDEMIDKKIWKFDDIEYDYELAKTITQYWVALSSFSILASKEIDLKFSLDEYRDIVNKTVIKKQKDYGPSNILRFGLNGLIIRMHDKIGRLENLFNNNLNPENESIKDNLLDVIGYSVLSIMWINQTFLLPMSANTAK